MPCSQIASIDIVESWLHKAINDNIEPAIEVTKNVDIAQAALHDPKVYALADKLKPLYQNLDKFRQINKHDNPLIAMILLKVPEVYEARASSDPLLQIHAHCAFSCLRFVRKSSWAGTTRDPVECLRTKSPRGSGGPKMSIRFRRARR